MKLWWTLAGWGFAWRLAAAAAPLKNEFLQVDVATDGLSFAVRDLKSGTDAHVANSWNVTLASQVLAPETCQLASGATLIDGKVRTSWMCAATGPQPAAHLPVSYVVGVDFSLLPGHRFVSKQLTVASSLPRSNLYGKFALREIAVWRSTIVSGPSGEGAALVSANPFYGGGSIAAWARLPAATVFVSVANPFVHMSATATATGHHLEAAYSPLMEHNASFSETAHVADVGILGFADRGQYTDLETGLFTHEAAAFRSAVDSFYLDGASRRNKTVKVHVAWDESDYQIDVSTASGWAQYRQIIDRCAQLGIDHIVFGPHNDVHSSRANTTDGWGWEQVLWFSMGERIRMGAFDPRVDSMPKDILQMVEYAKGKGVRLLAYVYPCLAFEPVSQYLIGNTLDLSVPEARDWLLSSLIAFMEKSGAGGFAWDHDIFAGPNNLHYAQWRAWMYILKGLRTRFPDIVMDHRQTAHMWGPWYHLAGSYPEPIAGDENPETYGVRLPSLSTDHVAADNMRAVNWIYSVQQLLPASRLPGFIFHQVERQDGNGVTPCEGNNPCYDVNKRDFDYQGYKYSLISSIATAGLNNVFTMLPARDDQEFKLFPKEDVHFIQDWLALADNHMPALARAAPIPTLSKPAVWREVDGWHAMYESDEGFVFLFNPTFGERVVELTIDESIGISNASNLSGWLIEELYPDTAFRRAPVKHGQKVQVTIQGSDALALRLTKANHEAMKHYKIVRGRKGRTVRIPWKWRPEAAICSGLPHAKQLDVTFAGDRIEHGMPISETLVPPAFAGGWFNTTFSIAPGIFQQLHARQTKYPIQWTEGDRNATWLDPSRLLMTIAHKDPQINATPRVVLDGHNVPVLWAFNGRNNPGAGQRCFTGYFVDATSVPAGVNHSLAVWLPPMSPGDFQGLFWENLDTEYTKEIAACSRVEEEDHPLLVI